MEKIIILVKKKLSGEGEGMTVGWSDTNKGLLPVSCGFDPMS